MPKHDLIFYRGRRTPEVVPRGGEAKKASHAVGKIIKRRAATEEEERVIARGDWLRVNHKGQTPKDKTYKSSVKSKIRPQNN